VSIETTDLGAQMLDGRRVAIYGKLVGMSRRDAEDLIRARGGQLESRIDAETQIVVLSDDAKDISESVILDAPAREAWHQGRIEVIRESEFWARLGLIDAAPDVCRLYTPAMLADLLEVPVSAVRHWHRKGQIVATCTVGRLAYFDFAEVQVGRCLADLFAAGCSLSTVDHKLEELAQLLPDLRRPLASTDLVVDGRRLYLRHGDNMAEPTGQLVIDFDAVDNFDSVRSENTTYTIPFAARSDELSSCSSIEEWRLLALGFEESGQLERAIETYRAILLSGEHAAEDHFYLGDLLYRSGDLAAARERYYAAIELDEDYLEARANLGCVLAEQGEMSLAEAAFRGALRYHPKFADAHFHLARLLDAMDRPHDATRHWQEFLRLAPASPWAEEARDRVGGLDDAIAGHSQTEHA
jgi:tetratricopeptide (TPR) repeat protein